jgi:hypothetical protein
MPSDREKIIAEYHSAVSDYRHAVSKMSGLSGTDFEIARKLAEQARVVCEEKRVLLDRFDSRDAR